ncbi:MAG: hypothetical protein ACFFER_15095, partial [Candidatus Thorarchaeota archaeon]
MLIDDDQGIQAIRIAAIPRTYKSQHARADKSSSQDPRNAFLKFERFLGGVLYNDSSLAYRMRMSSSWANLSFAVPSMSASESIKAPFLAQFSEFTLAESILDNSINSPVFCAVITGIPQLSHEPLNGLAEVMIQSKAECVYQVRAVPKKPNRIRRFLTKKRYQSASSSSQKQESQPGFFGTHEIRTKIDADAARKSKLYDQDYRRLCAAKVLECQVVLAFWGTPECGTLLQNAVSVLMASISSTDRLEQMKVKYIQGDRAADVLKQVLNLEYRSKTTQLLMSEAAPLFHIPTIEMAIEPSSPASFSTSGTADKNASELLEGITYRQGEIGIGSTYRSGTLDKESVKSLNLNDLKHHVFIGGKTGTGKSTTKNCIIVDAWKNGIPSLILEPVKTDARTL